MDTKKAFKAKVSDICREKSVTHDDLYLRWREDVKKLCQFVNLAKVPVGELAKLLADCGDRVQHCAPQFVEYFVKQIVAFAWFAREEAWKLENGELFHPFQVEYHKDFIVEGVDTLATGELSRTTRHRAGSKVSLLCHDGFLFGIKHNLLVSISNYFCTVGTL